MKKLFLNSNRCIACGLCTQEHPELFKLDDKGIAHLKKELNNCSKMEISDLQISELKSTISKCPGRAFSIEFN